jgi:hypothetical protein
MDHFEPTAEEMTRTLLAAGWRRSSRSYQADKRSKQRNTIRWHAPGTGGNAIGLSLKAAYRKAIADAHDVRIVVPRFAPRPIQGEQARYLEDLIHEGAFDDDCGLCRNGRLLRAVRVMVKIKATIVGGRDTPSEALRLELEQHAQQMARDGWTLRAMTSRGGSIYCVFARKVK